MISTLADTYTVRPAVQNDVEHVFRLISVNQLHWLGRVIITLDELRRLWTSPEINLATDSWLVFSAQKEVVGYALMAHTQHARFSVRCSVHPAYLEDGIDDFLLEAAERWAQQQVHLAAPDVRVTLQAYAMNENKAWMKALERHEFQAERTFWRMGIDLEVQPTTPSWPENIRIVTATPDMFRAIYEADEDIFQDHWGFIHQPYEEWEHWTVKRADFDPSLWYIAMDGQEIAGIALCAIERDIEGWVHVLGIKRAWRRNGLALSLLHHTFGEFWKRDMHQVYLSVDAQSLTGATRLYKRAGMHVVDQSSHYIKELRGGKALDTQTLAE